MQILLTVALLAGMVGGNEARGAPYPPRLVAVLQAPSDPVQYETTLIRARSALAAARWDEAAELYRQLINAFPADRETWTGLATVLRQQGQHAESIAAYERAIELGGPRPGRARYWIAVQQAALGLHGEAIATVRRMIEEDHELDRAALLADAAFKPLRADPRWSHFLVTSGTDRIAGWGSDLDVLLDEIRRLAPKYRDAPLPPATLEAAERLRSDIPSLSDEQVYARLAQVLGTLGMGHTMLWPIESSRVGGARLTPRHLPVVFYAFPDGLHVVDARDAHKSLMGMRLVAMDGVDAPTVVNRVLSATSHASPAEALWLVPVRMTDLSLLHGLGVARLPDRIQLTLADRAGHLHQAEMASTEHAWRPRLPPPTGVAPPAFLARTDESHWIEFWPTHATTYVQFNQVAPDPDEDLPSFGRRLRDVLEENGSTSVVIDLRHNNGGNTFTYIELLRSLVSFSTGERNRVYAVIGRNVYSAAANFVTDLERLANPVFVGEPTGMTGNQDGDEGQVVLPWSGLTATVSGVKWQLSHPWDKRASIAPHVPVQLTAEAFFAGRDPALDSVRTLIARRRESAGAASK